MLQSGFGANARFQKAAREQMPDTGCRMREKRCSLHLVSRDQHPASPIKIKTIVFSEDSTDKEISVNE